MYGQRQSPDNDAVSAPDTSFIEIKHRPDGRVESFHCALLSYAGRYALVRYTYESEFAWQGFVFRPGGFTRAWYWRNRPYLLYRMYGADGEHIVDRFDVIDRVTLRRSRCEYRDLYLDVWIGPDGIAHLDDEDELLEAESSGVITRDEAEGARHAARLLLRNHRRIIAAAERSAGG